MWGPLEGFGWLARTVVRVSGVQQRAFFVKHHRERESRAAARFLKQCPRFARIFFFLLLPNTKGQGRGGDATVNFVQRVVVVLG
jgi:uncharacterized membrane protein